MRRAPLQTEGGGGPEDRGQPSPAPSESPHTPPSTEGEGLSAEPCRQPTGLVAACGLHLELLGKLMQQHHDDAAHLGAAEGSRLEAERLDSEPLDAEHLTEPVLRAAFCRSSAALTQALLAGDAYKDRASSNSTECTPETRLVICTEDLDQVEPKMTAGQSDTGASASAPVSVAASDKLVSQILSPTFSIDAGERISGGSYVGEDGWDRDELVIQELRKPTLTRLGTQKNMGSQARRRKPPRSYQWLKRMLSKPLYEVAWALLIIINLIVMILEEEYRGMEAGHRLGGIYTTYGSPEYFDKWWPGASTTFFVFECVFAGLFTLELLITFSFDIVAAYTGWPSHRSPFWRDPLDLVDLVVVVCSDVALAIGMLDTAINIQLFRILRLARLLRLIRLLRKLNQFDPLHLMTTAIKGSMGALVFSCMLLLTILTLFAMVLTNVLRVMYLGDNSPIAHPQQEQLFRYFGTYSRSMLSMFELALANWPQITRFLTEELHECFGPICVLFKLSIGFAVIGVINGVFIRETFSVAESDEFIMVRSRMRQVMQHKDRMTRLFKLADRNEDGVLDREEFRRVFEKRAIRTWLEAMDLRCTDADTLFSLIAGSPDGEITAEELITGIALLKGPARNIDLLTLMHGLDVGKARSGKPAAARRAPSGVSAQSTSTAQALDALQV